MWTILLIVFFGFLGMSIPYLIFPALFLNPLYSILPADWSPASHSLLLGVTLAAYPLGQFVGSPVLGALSDDFGRQKLLSASLLLASIANLVTGLAVAWEHLTLIILSRFVGGLMEGNISIARAMAADIKSISKHESFGKINAVASIAYLLGPLIGGVLADSSGFSMVSISTPFYFISVLFFGLSILSAIMLKDSASKPNPRKPHRGLWQRFNLIHRMSLLFQNRELRFLMVISTFFTLAVDIFYEFGPVHLTALWMVGPVQLIIYNAVLCVGLALGNGWLANFASKRYSAFYGTLSAIGSFALFLSVIVLAHGPFTLLILFFLSGLSIGIGATLITVRISDSVADSIQGEVMGVQMSLRFLGDGVICLMGGVLLVISSQLVIFFAAVVAALTALYYALAQSNKSSI